MANPEQLIIPAGTMINLSMHEDDSAEILTEDVVAFIQGPVIDHALPVLIPVLDLERTYFLHQPEKSQSDTI